MSGRKRKVDELTNRGVTSEAAQALAAAIEPVFPARLITAGTEFELTLDRQQDFYGRDATFPVQLSFKPGPKESITVEADERSLRPLERECLRMLQDEKKIFGDERRLFSRQRQPSPLPFGTILRT